MSLTNIQTRLSALEATVATLVKCQTGAVPLCDYLDHRTMISRIQVIVAKAFEVPMHTMFNRSRRQTYVVPRHIAQYVCRHFDEAKPTPFEDIARAFKKDHGAVTNACQRVKDRMDTEPVFRAQVEAMLAKVRGTQ